MPNVSIRSATFTSCYLRLDGTGMKTFSGSGGGVVNCQTGVGPFETLVLSNPAGAPSDVFNIGSATFPNVFLRMDGTGVKGATLPNGGGTANLQVTAGPYEQFRLEKQKDGTTAIASVTFPGVYLRMDGTGVKASDSGSGVVNCQSGVGPYEKFRIGDIGTPLTKAELIQAITTYGPVLRLHPQETFFNTSIEYFLGHSKLVDTKSGTVINHPTVDQLPQSGDDKQYYLVLEDAAKGGDFTQAKAYVNARWEQGMSFTDLQFWLFSAYNGPGTAHMNGLIFDTIAHTGDVNLAPMGEHFGDWECVVVRIDNTTKTPVSIWLSQHDSGQKVAKEDFATTFQMDRTTHPIVYSSRNGHANYPTADSNYSRHIKVPIPAIPAGVEFFLRNDTGNGGKQLDCSQSYQIISAPWLTGADAMPMPPWVTYRFPWGPLGTSTSLSPSTVSDLMYAAAGPLAPFLPSADMMILAGQILPYIVRGDVNGVTPPIQQGPWGGHYPVGESPLIPIG